MSAIKAMLLQEGFMGENMLFLLCSINGPNIEGIQWKPRNGLFSLLHAIARAFQRVLLLGTRRPVPPLRWNEAHFIWETWWTDSKLPNQGQSSLHLTHLGIGTFLWRRGPELRVSVLSLTTLPPLPSLMPHEQARPLEGGMWDLETFHLQGRSRTNL